MKQRLAEMIMDSVGGCARNWAEIIADYLLANGVVVPPCKVGDFVKIKGDGKVWRVDALHFYLEGVPQVSISNKKVTNTFSVETFVEVMKILTREEAEKALEEAEA